MPEYPKCPDCGEERHNPKTGFCWKSKSRNPRSGFHCKHCCAKNIFVPKNEISDRREPR